jgi:hypothetical protein
MRIHKLEDGDIIKILPMVGSNNEIIMFKQLDAAHISRHKNVISHFFFFLIILFIIQNKYNVYIVINKAIDQFGY